MKAIVGPVENGAREPRPKRGRHRNMWPPPAPGATRTSSRAAQRGGVKERAGLLPPPARGERVGVRGPLRWAYASRPNLQRCGVNRSAQNRGEAPSPPVASRPPPLPARGERWVADKQNRS